MQLVIVLLQVITQRLTQQLLIILVILRQPHIILVTLLQLRITRLEPQTLLRRTLRVITLQLHITHYGTLGWLQVLVQQ